MRNLFHPPRGNPYIDTAVEERQPRLVSSRMMKHLSQQNDWSRDNNSLGGIPMGEFSRQMRKPGEFRDRPPTISPEDVRLQRAGKTRVGRYASNGSSDDGNSSSTMRRAAVMIPPRGYRFVGRRPSDPPSSSEKRSTIRKNDFCERQDYENDSLYYYDLHGRQGLLAQEDFQRARWIAGEKGGDDMQRPAVGSDWSVSHISEDLTEQFEKEFGETEARMKGPPMRGYPQNPTAIPQHSSISPMQPLEQPVRSMLRNRPGSQCTSQSSSKSSGAPVYTPEDSQYLLYGYADWAELPTQKTDPELQMIRRRFLRRDSSSQSTRFKPSTAGTSSELLSRRKPRSSSRDDHIDREGLPDGFYRHKDGTIQSFGSSAAASSSKMNSRYLKRTPSLEPKGIESEENAGSGYEKETQPMKNLDSTKYGTPMAWVLDENSIVATTCTARDTQNESTPVAGMNESAAKSDDGLHQKGLVSAFVQSFENKLKAYQTGIQRTPQVESDKQQHRVSPREPTESASDKTPSTVRRAKVKVVATVASAISINAPNQQPTQQLAKHVVSSVPHASAFNPTKQNSLSESQGYDDSTITSRESKFPQHRALVDVSRLPEKERPEYLNPTEDEQSFPASYMESHAKVGPIESAAALVYRGEDEQNDPSNHSERLKQLDQTPEVPTTEPHNQAHFMLSKPENEFRGATSEFYLETNRRLDRVHGSVPSKVAVSGQSVVSDITSLPKSNFHMPGVPNFETSQYGGFSVDDNIMGFFDKVALALRLVVFQPNGCR